MACAVRMDRLLFTAITLAACFYVVISVDRNNFKTCSQSGFCKRQRDAKPGSSQYAALTSQLQKEGSKITVPLLNKNNNIKLKLQLSGLKGDKARIHITEMDGIKERFEIPIGIALVEEPELEDLVIADQGTGGAIITFNSNKIVIQSDPFRIDILVEEQPVVSINSKSMLKYEHYRKKDPSGENDRVAEGDEAGQEAGQAAEGEEAPREEAEEEEPDMWEETFKTHKDTKPHGPSSVGLDVSFPGFEFVYGIPEHADTLALKTTTGTDPYRLYNLDVFEYETNNPMALYGSVPVMIAHNEARTVGIFWHNSAETWIDIRSNVADKNMFSKVVDFVRGGEQDIPQVDTHWMSESGVIDLFILLGPKPADVFKQYGSLTGTTPLPPLFALGYHQSRWNYNDEADVAMVNSKYDEHDLPMDVIWLDIEHTDGKRYFTWDAVKFPDSKGMINNVSAVGRKMVTIVDPHIKKDDNYFVHKQAMEQDLYVKNHDGNPYEGWCWPGSSYWPDYLNPKVSKFWAEKFHLNEYVGSTLDLYTWNDMNEPSVFNAPEITMHKDALHHGGWEHRDVHNIYGLLVHRATVDGHHLRNPQQRPFVLSRAFFSGTQRDGAVWTGDNTGEWSHLKISLPMILTLNLVGITLSGADVGGFFKNPDHELLTRWYQAAAFQPFFRAHAHLDTRRREPWLLEDQYHTAVREALRVRYRLLPYWYTLFYEGERDGSPIIRPLWVEFPTEKNVFRTEDEHLVGSALLVHPVTDAGASGVHVYLPGADQFWYDFDTNQRYTGGQNVYVPVDLNKIPVFRRGGHIVPQRERLRRASSLTYRDPFTLVVALDQQGKAAGTLYMDDYNSYKYKSGQYVYRRLTFEGNVLTNRNINNRGQFSTSAWVERVVVIGLETKPSAVQLAVKGVGEHPLEFTYDSPTKALVIRKPHVGINRDFTISVQ